MGRRNKKIKWICVHDRERNAPETERSKANAFYTSRNDISGQEEGEEMLIYVTRRRGGIWVFFCCFRSLV